MVVTMEQHAEDGVWLLVTQRMICRERNQRNEPCKDLGGGLTCRRFGALVASRILDTHKLLPPPTMAANGLEIAKLRTFHLHRLSTYGGAVWLTS
jgi:hypothetical protein